MSDPEDVNIELVSLEEERKPETRAYQTPQARQRKWANTFLLVVLFLVMVSLAIFVGRVLLRPERYSIPGLTLQRHYPKDHLQIKVRDLRSLQHPDEPLPYYPFYPLCRPYRVEKTTETIGELLRDDALSNSEYRLEVLQDFENRSLCEFTFRNAKEMQRMERAMREHYYAQWVLAGRDAFSIIQNETVQGFPFGYRQHTESKGHEVSHQYLFFTHLDLRVYYMDAGYNGTLWIVGLEVTPRFVNLEKMETHHVYNISYSVQWCNGSEHYDENTHRFEWDSLYVMDARDRAVSALDLGLSILVVFSVAGITLVCITQRVRLDVSVLQALKPGTSTASDCDAEAPGRTGWRRAVMRALIPPTSASTAVAVLAAGWQLALTILGVTAVGAFGFLYLNQHGEVLQWSVYAYVCASLPAGAIGGAMYRAFRGKHPLLAIVQTVLLVPVTAGLVLLPLTVALYTRGSRGTMTWEGWLWLGGCCASSVVVETFAFWVLYRRGPFTLSPTESPDETDEEYRTRVEAERWDPPARPWWWVRILVACALGFLLCVTVAVPVSYAMQGMWSPRTDTMYLGMLLSAAMWVVTIAVFAIVYTFWQLNAEDWRWWWSTALAMALPPCGFWTVFSIVYYAAFLDIHGVISAGIYFSYVCLFTIFAAYVSAGVGVMAAYLFFRSTLATITRKVD